MATTRMESELLWSIFCPFELFGAAGASEIANSPLTSNGAEPRKRASRLFFCDRRHVRYGKNVRNPWGGFAAVCTVLSERSPLAFPERSSGIKETMLLPPGNHNNGQVTARERASRVLFLIWSPGVRVESRRPKAAPWRPPESTRPRAKSFLSRKNVPK